VGKRKSILVLSTREEKYMEASHARKEFVWLQRLCSHIWLIQLYIRIDYDN